MKGQIRSTDNRFQNNKNFMWDVSKKCETVVFGRAGLSVSNVTQNIMERFG